MVNLRTEALCRVEDGIMYVESLNSGPIPFTKELSDPGQVTSPAGPQCPHPY